MIQVRELIIRCYEPVEIQEKAEQQKRELDHSILANSIQTIALMNSDFVDQVLVLGDAVREELEREKKRSFHDKTFWKLWWDSYMYA